MSYRPNPPIPRDDDEDHDYYLALKAPRRGAVDFNAAGVIRSDYWHRGMPSQIVTRNFDQLPGLRFFPVDGVNVGVALSECEYTQGMVAPRDSIFKYFPPHMQHLKTGVMVITVRTLFPFFFMTRAKLFTI